ncbi:MAG: hypothetical protein HC840_18205 [Leptolyngbyaceae cyanobacterium RM2_2_4]|nr:hypothetical protein [Leptolyngbyaceae cyanobacterium RM2_2_4]
MLDLLQVSQPLKNNRNSWNFCKNGGGNSTRSIAPALKSDGSVAVSGSGDRRCHRWWSECNVDAIAPDCSGSRTNPS